MAFFFDGTMHWEFGDKIASEAKTCADFIIAVAGKNDKLRTALEEIDSQAVAACLAKNQGELLDMLINVSRIAQKALGKPSDVLDNVGKDAEYPRNKDGVPVVFAALTYVAMNHPDAKRRNDAAEALKGWEDGGRTKPEKI